jgi:hypothetical protein
VAGRRPAGSKPGLPGRTNGGAAREILMATISAGGYGCG